VRDKNIFWVRKTTSDLFWLRGVEVVEGHAPPASLLVFIFNKEDEDQGERRCHVCIMEAPIPHQPQIPYIYIRITH
jgi:hypothetical protein